MRKPSHLAGDAAGHLRMPVVCCVDTGVSGSECVVEYHVGIIDFLQRWTLPKVMAHYIKVFERDKSTVDPTEYAEPFKQRAHKRITDDAKPLFNPSVVGVSAA